MTPPSQDETSPRALPQLPLRRGTLRDDTWRLAALLLGSVVVVIVGGLWLVVRFDLPEVAVTITTLLAIVLPIVVVLGRAEGSVTMGDDGFVIRDGRLSRFVAFDEVTDIRPWWGHPSGSKQAYFMARVELAHGPPLDLIVAGVPSTSEGQSKALLARLQAGLQAFAARRSSTVDVASALVPRDEDLDAWLARLTGLGAGVATSRTAAFGPDHLWRLVEDPTADALPRAAAAFALRGDASPEGRARLQSLAARCADPTLADALVQIGGDDAAAAVAVLAAMRESTARAAPASHDEFDTLDGARS